MSARGKILDFMQHKSYRPLTEKELFVEFEIRRGEGEGLKEVLAELVKEGLVFKNDRGRYGIPEKMDVIAGRIEGNARGFAFLLPDDPARDDVFISRENINGAMHNDRVFVRLLTDSGGKRQEGEVVKVLERVNKRIVGNFEKNRRYGFVVPDNKRLFYDLFIPPEEIAGARNEQKVVAEITAWPGKKRNPEGRIVEVLGYKGEPGVDIAAIIHQLGLPQDFPAKVLREVEDISLKIPEEEIKKRRDLRQLPMVTIDGADAKDLDDAVSIEELGEGKLRLGVHIADVSHYVRKGTALDDEAMERGTSIYLVDRVIPMLPRELSNGICSLNPAEDRLTLSVYIVFQMAPFKIIDHEIFTSVIRTRYRLTYEEVGEILLNNNQELMEKYADFVPQLRLMNELREKLRKGRFEAGSVNFDFPEVKVILDEEGRPVEIKRRQHGISEQLIEEFMIAANRVVAEDISWREIPFIYRVHDQPDSDRLLKFNEFIRNFGYHLKGVNNQIHPRVLQELLESVGDKPEERVISTMLLRSMKQAIYTPENIGHFGLAIDYYTHFTSPIRRYPDLIIHRIIKEVLSRGHLPEGRIKQLKENLYQIAEHSSLQERKAMEAERDSVDLKKMEYMKDKVGQEFEGVISGVTGFGFFVELENTVEGLVHVETLKDDFYHYNEEQQALIGERLKKIYRFGSQVRVKIEGVNLEERQLDFSPVEE